MTRTIQLSHQQHWAHPVIVLAHGCSRIRIVVIWPLHSRCREGEPRKTSPDSGETADSRSFLSVVGCSSANCSRCAWYQHTLPTLPSSRARASIGNNSRCAIRIHVSVSFTSIAFTTTAVNNRAREAQREAGMHLIRFIPTSCMQDDN